MSGKPDFELPKSAVMTRISEFLAAAEEAPDLQLNCVITDQDEIAIQPAPQLDYDQVVQFDVVAGLFEVQKKE